VTEGLTLEPAVADFVERMGLAYEHMGMARTAGRLFGLLMIADEPLALDELARVLQVSKASVSTNVRVIQRFGLVERITRPGDRRDFYRVLPGALEKAVARRVAATHEFIDLAETGIEAVGEAHPAGRERLIEMRDYYRFMAEGLEELTRQWKERGRD